jgi:hypothetical protein
MEALRSMGRFLVRLVLLNIVLVPLMVLGPLFYLLPFPLIAASPRSNFSWLAQAYIWLGPLSGAFWILLSCHWQTVRRAQREGRLATWRDSEGGIVCTVTKATVYMFAGLFASFVFEVAFAFVFRLRPGNPYQAALWFALLPFATFGPVILLWLRRWMRSRKRGDFISRAKGDRELRATLHAISMRAKSMRSQNAH